MTETNTKKKRPAGSGKKRGPSKAELEQLAKKKRMRDEICAIILMAVGAFLVVSLQTDAAGQFGHTIKLLLMGLFGRVAYLLPYYLILYGFLIFVKQTSHTGSRSTVCVLLVFVMLVILNASFYLTTDGTEKFGLSFLKANFDSGIDGGGVIGMVLGLLLVKTVGKTGLYILCTVVSLVSVMLVINTPVSQFFDQFKEKREAAKLLHQAEDQAAMALDAEKTDKAEKEELKKHNFANAGAEYPKSTVLEKGSIAVTDMTDLAGIPVMEKPSFLKNIPIQQTSAGNGLSSMSDGSGLSLGQMKIINYMKDDELFEKGEATATGLGMEEQSVPETGKGLNGEALETESLASKTSEPAKEKNSLSGATAPSVVSPGIPLKKDGTSSVPYKMPPLDLLNKTTADKNIGESVALKAKAMKLEETLHDFGVNAKVVQVTKGPAVTRYEIQPSTGVKVSSIVRLADDIALNLEAKSIRMEAPIPGKAAVGIEVENDRVNMVSIREIVESGEFKAAKSKITFAVGKDIAGKAIVSDLKGMPHLLIAGSTGSGKSVCINSLIISILYKARPEEVKFVLIDPKVVELNNYNGIPHLLIPVVTDPSKAAAALNWAVAEMTDRYKKFAEDGVRDLESFNTRIKEKGETDRYLPQIVIIIDELADLMMAAPSQVEESICRLAQMARAAGMHLIVATQRPSVDIITGVIKANIPSRIAFAVSSQFDSRTILDMGGAEKLVGKGDMLFNPIGNSKPVRVQGCFISDTEVHKVIEFLKQNTPNTEYAEDVLHTIDRVQSDSADEDADELLSDAIETVVRAEQASVSMLQRRFRIGYNRAARLVDMMESRGIIGPSDGSRPRKVLMSLDELLGLGAAPPVSDSGE